MSSRNDYDAVVGQAARRSGKPRQVVADTFDTWTSIRAIDKNTVAPKPVSSIDAMGRQRMKRRSMR